MRQGVGPKRREADLALESVMLHGWASRLGVGFVLSPQPVYPRPGEPGSEGGLGESSSCGPVAPQALACVLWSRARAEAACHRGGPPVPSCDGEHGLALRVSQTERMLAHRLSFPPRTAPPASLSPLWSSSSPCPDHRHAWCWGGS